MQRRPSRLRNGLKAGLKHQGGVRHFVEPLGSISQQTILVVSLSEQDERG
jgi:hypothetical protein